jgi:hypothetical protein
VTPLKSSSWPATLSGLAVKLSRPALGSGITVPAERCDLSWPHRLPPRGWVAPRRLRGGARSFRILRSALTRSTILGWLDAYSLIEVGAPHSSADTHAAQRIFGAISCTISPLRLQIVGDTMSLDVLEERPLLRVVEVPEAEIVLVGGSHFEQRRKASVPSREVVEAQRQVTRCNFDQLDPRMDVSNASSRGLRLPIF